MAARTLPPPLHIESEKSPEWVQMMDRVKRWRMLYPAVWAKFWSVYGVKCVFCGREGGGPWGYAPDGKYYLNFTVVTWPGFPAYNALQVGGLDAFYYTDVSDREYWAGWCRQCAPPSSAVEWDMVAEAAWRRAAKPDAPGQ